MNVFLETVKKNRWGRKSCIRRDELRRMREG
jgi:hypothetical protein